MTRRIKISDICSTEVGGEKLAFFLGVCVIESEEHVLKIAQVVKDLSKQFDNPFIFKASFDKANRTSINSFRGPGLEEGLKILQLVKKEFQLPLIVDIHEASQAQIVAEVADVIQIPAFLCRQTDLVVAAAKTGKVVNIKKAQFMAPWDMKQVVNKVEQSNNTKILVTERGATFGYNNLVVDFTSVPIMQKFGYPVLLDVTHALQLPGGKGNETDGRREYVEHISCAGVAVGVDALFLEIHDKPELAKSDAATSFHISKCKDLIEKCIAISEVVRERNDT